MRNAQCTMHNAQCAMRNTQCTKRTRRCAFAVFAVFLFMPLLVSALPRMPMGFKAAVSNDTGKTWRETGSLSQPLAMARVSIRSSMIGQGYVLVHDIAEGENAVRRLQLWRSGSEDVILMIWQEDLYTTGISWGLSERNGADGAGGDEPGSSAITNYPSGIIPPGIRQPDGRAIDHQGKGRKP